MARPQQVIETPIATVNTNEETTKDALQGQLQDTRESISQTVSGIKDSVVHQYESVKESINEVVDWREQYKRHPVAWSIGAVGLGLFAGYTLAGNYKEIDAFKHLQTEMNRLSERFLEGVSDIGDQFVGNLSNIGDRVLDEMPNAAQYVAPAIVGAALPILAAHIKDRFGFDIAPFLPDQKQAEDKAFANRARADEQNVTGVEKKKKKNKKNKKKEPDLGQAA